MHKHPLLVSLHACNEAQAFAADYPTIEAAWHACHRGDWLLWLAGRVNIPRPMLVLAACACAREALIHVPAGEFRPLKAIETAEAWARSGHDAPSLSDVRSAASAAAYDAAAYAAYAASAAYAAASAAAYDAAYAASAAYAAYDAAYAAYDAAYATYSAASAAAAAASAAEARKESLAKSADIVRCMIPWNVIDAAIKAGSK